MLHRDGSSGDWFFSSPSLDRKFSVSHLRNAVGVGGRYRAIGIFMIDISGMAMRRFLGAPYLAVVVGLAVFIAALRFAEQIPCNPELLPITVAAGRPCFNGSLGYVPALAALLLMGAVLITRGHGAGWPVFVSGIIFAVSLTLRTVDFEWCSATSFLGRSRGTHALWHTLNALLLFVLLAAAIRHGSWGPKRIGT